MPCARIKDRSASASGKGGIEDQKTRTLEHHKGAAPKIQKRLNPGAPAKGKSAILVLASGGMISEGMWKPWD
jgi:hypothetical protein